MYKAKDLMITLHDKYFHLFLFLLFYFYNALQ